MATQERLDFDRYRIQLQEVKGQLEADLEAYQRREAEMDGGPNEPGPGQHWEHAGYGDHLADDGTELFEREKSIGLEQTLQEHLRHVNHALARIDEGTYGTCERCGKPIAKERLDAIPEATLCIEHKAQDERRRPMSNRYAPGTSS
ncbi:MAG: TraR/DksA family transcriptional regulator [Chloroflexota bacterium]